MEFVVTSLAANITAVTLALGMIIAAINATIASFTAAAPV
jgi:hypothetical protein